MPVPPTAPAGGVLSPLSPAGGIERLRYPAEERRENTCSAASVSPSVLRGPQGPPRPRRG